MNNKRAAFDAIELVHFLKRKLTNQCATNYITLDFGLS